MNDKDVPKTIWVRSVACDHEGCFGDCGRMIEIRNPEWKDDGEIPKADELRAGASPPAQ